MLFQFILTCILFFGLGAIFLSGFYSGKVGFNLFSLLVFLKLGLFLLVCILVVVGVFSLEVFFFSLVFHSLVFCFVLLILFIS